MSDGRNIVDIPEKETHVMSSRRKSVAVSSIATDNEGQRNSRVCCNTSRKLTNVDSSKLGMWWVAQIAYAASSEPA